MKGPSRTQRPGFVGALRDGNFDHLATPRLIKVFYVLALLWVTASVLVVVAIGLWLFQLRNGWLVGMLVVLGAPFLWLFAALLVRILMESIVVRFKGVEYLRVIADAAYGRRSR